MSIRKKNTISKKAFSLIELSVVIVILSIMITGLLSISVNSATTDKVRKSKENMDLIYQALGVYLLKHKALPCPAPITSVRSTNQYYGKAEGIAGTCADQNGVYIDSVVTSLAYGMVPTLDLELPSSVAEDGFGNKFGYLVDKNFTNPTQFGVITSYVGFDVSNGNNFIANSGDPAIFAIISYGANKYGTFNANSASQNINNTPSIVEEQRNYPGNFTDAANPASNTATFTLGSSRMRLYLTPATNSSTDMDDIILFKTRNDLIRDFQAFSLIKCPVVAANSSDVNKVGYGSTPTYMAWGSGGLYGQVTLSDTNCPAGWLTTVQKPGRRCGAFGKWEGGGVYDGAGGVVDPASIAIPCTQ